MDDSVINFGDESVLIEAFERLAHRIKGIGGVLSNAEHDPHDIEVLGSILFDLGHEADALLALARKRK